MGRQDSDFCRRYVEITAPRLPMELRNMDRRNIRFLSLVSEFRVGAVSRCFIYFRAAVYAAIDSPDLLKSGFGAVCEKASEALKCSADEVRINADAAARDLWCSCDGERLMERFYPKNSKSMPEAGDTLGLIVIFAELMGRE